MRETPPLQPIFIIGSGAVGKALAVSLHQAGRRTLLIRASVSGLTEAVHTYRILQEGEKVAEAAIPTFSLDQALIKPALIVVTTKAFGNVNLAKALLGGYPKVPLVIMQNGLEVERPFMEAGFTELYRCVLFMTSQNQDPYSVSFKPVRPSLIGSLRHTHSQLAPIVETLHTQMFPFATTDSLQSFIWEKAILNCVFNSICPLLEVDNGIFHREPEVMNLAENIVDECLLVSEQVGIRLDKQVILEKALTISKTSDGQLISTLQDIRRGRQTEIEYLNLAITRKAAMLGMATQTPKTELLGDLIKQKEQLNLK